MNSLDKFILALDVSTQKEALELVSKFYPTIKIFKVGKELFTREGPSIVKEIQKIGGKVFLDLKFHDIPNTVERASRAAAQLGVFMFTVHTLGGADMMKAARGALDGLAEPKPFIVGVTILTSLSDEALKTLGFFEDSKMLVLRLAAMAKAAGCDGVVSSAEEVSWVKKEMGRDFLVVTPGIRFLDTHSDDQKRVSTPEAALSLGSDFLVLGRSLLQSKDPLRLLKEFNV